MVKHIQTIPREFADKLFECVWPFSEIGHYATLNPSMFQFRYIQTSYESLNTAAAFI